MAASTHRFKTLPRDHCDVCGHTYGVRNRASLPEGTLRRTVAPWIELLCSSCVRRLSGSEGGKKSSGAGTREAA